MPLIRKFIVDNELQCALWHKTESAEELLAGTHNSIQIPPGLLLEKRRQEYICTRLLKNEIGIRDEILFFENGKPFMPHGPMISISHGERVAGFVAGESSCGMDLQKANAKIEKISTRFCSESELQEARNSSDPLGYLTILWSAKEAIFKIFGEHVHFAEHIRIGEFDPQNVRLSSRIIRDDKIYYPSMYYENVLEHHLVIAWLSNK